ncbi:protein translocase subunit SecF [Acidobacteriota bacterium]
MQIFNKPNFKFMKYKILALAVSGVIIAVGLINITVGKGINYGIDFAGGTLIRVAFQDEVPIADVRAALANAGFGNAPIQKVNKSEREYMIRTMLEMEGQEISEDLEAHEIMGQRVIEALRSADEATIAASGRRDLNSLDESELTRLLEQTFPERASIIAKSILGARVRTVIFSSYDQIKSEAEIDDDAIDYLKQKTYLSNIVVLSKESVGPQVGEELRQRTTQAAVWALIGMLIYIGIRFRFSFGVAAIITLTHDLLVVVGIFSLTNRELNLPVVAALLTIIGYSLNDTIVIFDRVRDNLKILRKHKLGELLNVSINQTLSRTVITSGTTFLTVLALFIFGGKVINDFAFTIMIGVIVGTYSSIYMSCSMLLFWNKFFKPKKGLGK